MTENNIDRDADKKLTQNYHLPSTPSESRASAKESSRSSPTLSSAKPSSPRFRYPASTPTDDSEMHGNKAIPFLLGQVNSRI